MAETIPTDPVWLTQANTQRCSVAHYLKGQGNVRVQKCTDRYPVQFTKAMDKVASYDGESNQNKK